MGEQLLTKKSDINISVSASNQLSGQKTFKGFESVVVNNGIDQNKFDPARSFKDVRSELNVPKDITLVLFVARFIHQKQPLKLLAAFAQAVKQLPSLRLLMVGDGDQKPEALEMVKQLGIADQVIFAPFRQDVPDVLAVADIFVLPSLWEGLPIDCWKPWLWARLLSVRR
ncbi:glycosyltransferase [Paraflavitalea speifideaquila]|uniref:glycosyltransferase n=1 Tax=Paraflavitalea speifideaquila TaxID=3076558 RepID=UPI0028E7370E|nr:glycosyltransferase [Paraflavitalea speifideiaquila]